MAPLVLLTLNLFYSSMILADNPPCNLHGFMSGSHSTVVKLLLGSDENLFKRVEDAVQQLVGTALTKRTRIEQTFPSPSEYAKGARSFDVNDHIRPSGSGLHVSLQVKAFGDFIDAMNSSEIDLGAYNVASRLMHTMSCDFGTEEKRKEAFLEELIGFLPPANPVAIGRKTTDATVKVTIDNKTHYLVNYEFKNAIKGVASDPFQQNSAYFIHLQQAENPDRSPMLLVIVVGFYLLQVYGAVWNGSSVCVDPLSSPASLMFVPRDPTSGVEKTARILAAIGTTIPKLIEYYSNPHLRYKGPYFDHDGQLTEMKRLNGGAEWVFAAQHQSWGQVVVKFVRFHYGEEVHRLLAENSLAPKLFLCSQLPGGWFAIVMERVKGSPIKLPVSQAVETSLQTVTSLLDCKDLVHGDLRPQNILVVGNSVRVLDFDWAGKHPTAKYPKELNMTCNWHPDVMCGGIITKEHDLYQIQQITAG